MKEMMPRVVAVGTARESMELGNRMCQYATFRWFNTAGLAMASGDEGNGSKHTLYESIAAPAMSYVFMSLCLHAFMSSCRYVVMSLYLYVLITI